VGVPLPEHHGASRAGSPYPVSWYLTQKDQLLGRDDRGENFYALSETGSAHVLFLFIDHYIHEIKRFGATGNDVSDHTVRRFHLY